MIGFDEIEDRERGESGINFEQFLVVMERKTKNDNEENSYNEENLVKSFKTIDQDCDNRISIDDLRELMTSAGESITEEELMDMIVLADKKGDRMISLEEFSQVLNLP